jgi:hypothetical protein
VIVSAGVTVFSYKCHHHSEQDLQMQQQHCASEMAALLMLPALPFFHIVCTERVVLAV